MEIIVNVLKVSYDSLTVHQDKVEDQTSGNSIFQHLHVNNIICIRDVLTILYEVTFKIVLCCGNLCTRNVLAIKTETLLSQKQRRAQRKRRSISQSRLISQRELNPISVKVRFPVVFCIICLWVFPSVKLRPQPRPRGYVERVKM